MILPKLGTPVKLVIEGKIDPYFGILIEITDTNITVEHQDCDQTVDIEDITEIIL